MKESSHSIVESREEFMISPASQENPIFRKAHFLKPSITSNLERSSLSLPSLPPTFDPQNWPLSVNFHGWRHPQRKWSAWVRKMASFHKPTWKKAGIYEAILNSTYQILKNNLNNDLILGVAERWCPETKSFIFAWGEATITLEDMIISGYSVLGSPVFNPNETEELKGVKEKLVQARVEIVRTSAKKACQYLWLNKFMDSGSEIEHEAFLSLWLSRFVLSTSFDVICECIFPIAVHLARGTRLALAPAVLASIYRDLSILKECIVSFTTLAADKGSEAKDDNKSNLAVTIFSPFQLVLVWVWERFVKLRPKPNLIKNGEPRLAIWNNLKCKSGQCGNENVRLNLDDSSKESFKWRPYTKIVENWDIPKFYREQEMWVSMNSDLDEELLSFIRCLRVSELVGIECTEQYLPHRVARQFGIDQDVPGSVPRSNESLEVAWCCYSRRISDVKCYIPSRFVETDVTTRYLEWWNRSVSTPQDTSKSVVQQRKSSTCFRKTAEVSKGKQVKNFVSSFKTRPKSLEEKKAANNVKRLKASTKTSEVMKKDEFISSFIITPKDSKRAGNNEILISSFKITPKKAKENKEDSSDFVNYGSPPSSSKIFPQILKRKKVVDSSVALGSPAKQSKTSIYSSRRNNEEYGESGSPSCASKTLAEINNLPVPPGFPPKCRSIEASGPSEENDDLTITQMLNLCEKHDFSKHGQCSNEKSLSGKCQSHSSESNNEAAKTSVLEASEERNLNTEAVENGKGGDCENARAQSLSPLSSTADNGALNFLEPVTSVEKMKHSEAAENRHDSNCNGNGENASSQLGQSQNHSSSSEGNETSKNLEKQVISAEKVTTEYANDSRAGSQAHKTDNITENEEGCSRYSFDALEVKLEARIRRLERIMAERKAVMF
ncbi:hypothetical protein JCGZ_00856 [Jatropha curcas]|uniref:Aminotransferase-like plant mobile domain-containing protein n=1 Tax=Jatropha curcas TaxID=180498 RepID=A0A067L4T4_JATCU|nr:uncharacterized protein LOC105632927 [Jatropha curcas]KDP39099.1 hypothetical protein JCGZ_00856 [Jatropha curcas]